jgi:type IV secretory pathway VirB4 component
MTTKKINTTESKKNAKYSLFFGEPANLDCELPLITSIEDRFQHTYVVGKTGMGKSSLMERMAFYDIKYGNAVVYIDPKGDSTKRLYSLLPDKSKAVYISIESPKVINPMDNPKRHLDEIITEFVQILDVLITLTASNPESTVLMREIIGMAIRAIEKEENRNIEYLVKFLLYDNAREQFRRSIKDERVKEYWKEFDSKTSNNAYKNKDKHECAKRVASRLIEISEGRMKDFVIGRNELDISEVVEQGKIIFVDTSKMSMNVRIYLSNLIVYSILSYCEFSDIKPKPLLVYVDEFQLVISNWFADLLARSRSRKVGFTLAHQSFAQIPKNILSTIIDTVHNIICFRTGDEVANRLSGFFDVKAKELFNLPKYNAYIRIGTDNALVECYPPLEVKNPIETPSTLPSSEAQGMFNFLKDGWIPAFKF